MTAKTARTAKKQEAALNRLEANLDKTRRMHGYTYFVFGDPGDGYRFVLTDRDGEALCISPALVSNEACLKSLRAVQRHAGTTDIRDDTR